MQITKTLQSCISLILIAMQVLPTSARAQNLLSGYSTYDTSQRQFVDSMVDLCTDSSKTEIFSLNADEKKYADPKKKDLGYVVANYQVDGEREVRHFNCEKVGVGPVDLKRHKDLASGATLENSCKKNAWKNDFDSIVKTTEALHYQEQLKSCEKTGTKLLSSNCLKEVGCDVARSMIALSGPVGWLMRAVGSKVNAEFRQCTSPSKGSCIQSLIKGLIDDLWGMVEGIWSGIKWVGGKIVEGVTWLGNKVSEAWNFLTSNSVRQMEQKTTKKVMAAAGTTKSQINRFLSDPWGFIKNSVTGFMNKVFEGVSGLAKKGTLAWKCSTCTELLQGGCKIAGYIGGEVLMAFLTGGAVNIAGKVGKGMRGASEIASIMEKMGQAAESTMKFASKAAATRLGRGLASVAKIPGKLFQGLEKIPLVGKLGRKFVELNEDAFMRGMLGKSGFASWKAEKELGATLEAVKKIRGEALAPEEKALIADHPEVEWDKLNRKKVDDLLTAYKQQDNAHSDKLDQLKVLAESNPAEAKKLAKEMAELDKKASDDYAKNFKGKAADQIRESANRRAEDLLAAGEVKNSEDYLNTVKKAEKSLGRELTEAEKETIYKAHRVGAGELGKDGTFAAKGNYTQGQIKEKLEILSGGNQKSQAAFSLEERKKLLFDGVAGAESQTKTIPELMQAKPADVHVLAKVTDQEAFKLQVNTALDTRNQLYLAWQENKNDQALYKQYRKHEDAVKEMEYFARKKLVLKPEEAQKLFAKPEIPSTSSASVTHSSGANSAPANAAPAYSKTVDESLGVIADYSKRYHGDVLSEDFKNLNKMPTTAEKGSLLQNRIAEQEKALQELADMKKAHSSEAFEKTGTKAGRNADTEIKIREEKLIESIGNLKKEQSSYLSSFKHVNSQVETVGSGEFRDYALKNAKERGLKPNDPFVSKVKDEIADLEQIKKGFKKGELPALDKVDLDAEITRLKNFVKEAEGGGKGSLPAAGSKSSSGAKQEITYSKGKVTTDEDGSWYIGYDKISAKNAQGKDIGFVSYKIDEESKTLTIGWSRVDEAERGKGYQTDLFKKMFEAHPEIKTVRTSLDDVNQSAFSGKLADLVKGEKNYVKPSGQTVDQVHLDRLTKKEKFAEKELNECCAAYLSDLQKKDPKRFESLMDEALKGTPAWKTREKFGFSKFGDMKNYYFRQAKDGSINFKVEFDATKP